VAIASLIYDDIKICIILSVNKDIFRSDVLNNERSSMLIVMLIKCDVGRMLLKQGPYGGLPVLRRILIVTPSSLVVNWQNEFLRWLGQERIQTFVVDQVML
jgi:hypothetical protein